MGSLKEYGGSLIGPIIGIPVGIVYSNLEHGMGLFAASLVSVASGIASLLIIMGLVSVFKWRPAVKTSHVVLGISITLVVLLSLFSWSSVRKTEILGAQMETAQLALTTQAQRLTNTASTQTAQRQVIAAQLATIEYLETQALAATAEPEIKTIYDLPPCHFEQMNYPCRHFTEDGEFASVIAENAYGNAGLAGRIAELYRDDRGTIPAFVTDKLLIIPDHLQPQDIGYYEFYFGLLIPPLLDCPDVDLRFPCWRVSEGESYELLAAGFYPVPTAPDCIRAANKTEWNSDLGRLDPKRTTPGTITVLPDCSS